MIGRVDRAIIDWAERQAHRCQRAVGLTNFDLARLCLAAVVLLLAQAGLVGGHPAWLASAAVGSFAMLYGQAMCNFYASAEEHYRSAPDTAHENTLTWRASSWERLKALVVVGGAAFWGNLWYLLAALSWLAALYLQCGIPLPPSTNRLQQWRQRRQQEREVARAVSAPSH